MKVETWLPILTLGLGWGLAQLTELLKDQRASTRERQTRQGELQRNTLLKLQDVILEVSWAADGVDSDMLRRRSEDTTGTIKVPQDVKDKEAREARTRLWGARDNATVLASRVQDAQARNDTLWFLDAAYEVGTADEEASQKAMERLHKTFDQAIDTLGALIRERY